MSPEEISDPLDAAACRACGAPVMGRYCQQCGQRHRPDLPPLGVFLREAIGGLLELDGPVWRSVRALVTRPGALTLAYRRGELSTHVSPVKLYIVASAFYFLVSRAVDASSALFVRFTGGESATGLLGWMEPIMILIVPAFGAIVMLVRRRDGLRYLAHLVFALHVQSAWFLLLGVAVLIDALPFPWERLAAFDVAQTLAFVYMAAALRRVYGLGWGVAVIQAFLVMVLYVALLLPTAIGATWIQNA